MSEGKTFWKSLGPGLLFAGAAVGVSHIVQSTQAGAIYGLGLIAIMVVAVIAKYPAYRFGPQYAAITGKSLTEAYAGMGKWVAILFGIAMLPSLAIIIAAVAITTAGMFNAVTGAALPATHSASVLIVLSIIILLTGGYSLLERITKVFVVIFTVATFVATILVLPSVQWNFSPTPITAASFTFIIAFIGLMPAGMDLSVMHSLWTRAKLKSGQKVSLHDATLDFNVGYLGTILLALCFILMGAGVMHSEGIAPSTAGAAAFAGQVVDLYRSTLGNWSGVVVGTAALAIIFTTLITILDGMPRVITSVYMAVMSEDGTIDREIDKSRPLLVIMIIMGLGAIIILYKLMSSFGQFIQLTTILAFFMSPFIALLNHLAMHGREIPEESRPTKLISFWSIAGILVLFTMSAAFIYTLL